VATACSCVGWAYVECCCVAASSLASAGGTAGRAKDSERQQLHDQAQVVYVLATHKTEVAAMAKRRDKAGDRLRGHAGAPAVVRVRFS
jgi:hypothetical protein